MPVYQRAMHGLYKKGSEQRLKMKKKGAASFYVVLFGIIIFVLLLIPTGKIAGNVWNAITGKSSANEKSLEEFTAALLEVAAMPGEVAGNLYSFGLNPETALIVMNPHSRFGYEIEGASGTSRYLHHNVDGGYFNRPTSCIPGRTCVCLCEDVSFTKPSQEWGVRGPGFGSDFMIEDYPMITCSRTVCNSYDGFVVPEISYMHYVFDDSDDRERVENIPRTQHYWNNSLIIMRSSEVDPSSYSSSTGHSSEVRPRIISGYRDMVLLQRFDVFIYKAGYRDGKPVISICFKNNPEDNCLPRTGPFQ